MELLAIAACVLWAVTTCVLIVVFLRALREKDERQVQEVALHRVEIEGFLTRQEALLAAHREEIAALVRSQRAEVADLCQRIQAPQIAVAAHTAQNASPDPFQPHLDDDDALLEIRRREQELDSMAATLTLRAEELAAER